MFWPIHMPFASLLLCLSTLRVSLFLCACLSVSFPSHSVLMFRGLVLWHSWSTQFNGVLNICVFVLLLACMRHARMHVHAVTHGSRHEIFFKFAAHACKSNVGVVLLDHPYVAYRAGGISACAYVSRCVFVGIQGARNFMVFCISVFCFACMHA